MSNRQKLQPFLNKGFVFKDRRKDKNKQTSDPKQIELRKIQQVRYGTLIENFRRKLEYATFQKDAFEIEKLLAQISE